MAAAANAGELSSLEILCFHNPAIIFHYIPMHDEFYFTSEMFCRTALGFSILVSLLNKKNSIIQ